MMKNTGKRDGGKAARASEGHGLWVATFSARLTIAGGALAR
jgi:hypothetical protein